MNNYSSWDLVLKATLENEVREAVNSLGPNGVLYDVGGNVGSFTDMVLQRLPDVQVFLFEPIREYYDHIVERFAHNPKVKAFNCALIDSNRDLTISRCNTNLGWNTLSEILSYGSSETVTGRTLSELVETENIPLPDVVKVDVEQSEYLFVEGCKDLFKKHMPTKIVMEIGINPAHHLWNKEVAMIEYLFSLGYKRYDYKELTRTYDAIFIK